MKYRHQDYILPVGDLDAGATSARLVKNLQTDAPFVLTQIGGYRSNRNPLSKATIQFTDEQGNWLQNAPTGAGGPGDMAALTGQNGLYTPWAPQHVYSPGSSIVYQVTNNSASAWEDAVIVLRGVKLFELSQIWSPTPPACRREEYFVIPYDLTFTQGVQTFRNLRFTLPAQTYGFVLRGLTIATFADTPAGSFSNLGIQLQDAVGKAYQDDYIQIDWLFSADPQRPGLLVPEIYMQPNDELFFNVTRNDAGNDQLDVQLCFVGAKVYNS